MGPSTIRGIGTGGLSADHGLLAMKERRGRRTTTSGLPSSPFLNVLQEVIMYLSSFLTKYGLFLPCCLVCTQGCDLGKKGAFPLKGGGRYLLTCLSSPGGLCAIELYVACFSLAFPVFVQIKTVQKKGFLWVNSNTWSVGKKSGYSPLQGIISGFRPKSWQCI